MKRNVNMEPLTSIAHEIPLNFYRVRFSFSEGYVQGCNTSMTIEAQDPLRDVNEKRGKRRANHVKTQERGLPC